MPRISASASEQFGFMSASQTSSKCFAGWLYHNQVYFFFFKLKIFVYTRNRIHCVYNYHYTPNSLDVLHHLYIRQKVDQLSICVISPVFMWVGHIICVDLNKDQVNLITQMSIWDSYKITRASVFYLKTLDSSLNSFCKHHLKNSGVFSTVL